MSIAIRSFIANTHDVGRLENKRDGLLITDIDPNVEYYDSTRAWRGRAMQGDLHSGNLVEDPRSEMRTEV